MKRRERGQSILEYVIVLTAIVAAVIAGAALFANSNDKSKGVGLLMDNARQRMDNSTGKIATINP